MLAPRPTSVFQFLDAREFLQQIYDQEKQRSRIFSHRYIAKAMGARSSSFFKDVLSGRIQLNPARVRGFVKLFKLPPHESEYFETLVLYNQAEADDEKQHYLKQLMSHSQSRGHAILDAFQMEYFRKWFYAAVREMVSLQEFHGDYKKLADMLDPPITPGEATDAINLLLKLKLIRKNAQGHFEKVDKVVSSGNGNPDLVKPALRENLELASKALDQFAPKIRPFSYLTLSISETSFLILSEKLRSFRKEILEIASQDEAADRLYQLNFQLFPLSKVVKRGKK